LNVCRKLACQIELEPRNKLSSCEASILGLTAPSLIRSLLSKHDLSGKTLVPFITHGGYGLGQSLSVIAEQSPQAQLLEGLFLEADQERRTLEQVTSWLGGVQITR
jgi:flavodoxin